MSLDVAPIDIDREQAFLLYATFCGDLEKTAHALGVPAMAVLRMADECEWNTKLAGILKLKKSNRPGDIERGINRALNFVQAHQLRLFVERVIRRLHSLGDEDFTDYLFTTSDSKTGVTTKKLSTRALADLASAMEKCQSMSYLALSDTAQDRGKRGEDVDAGESGGELHAQIAAAMSAVGKDNSPRAQLFDAQLEQAMTVKQEPINPPNPNDNDDH